MRSSERVGVALFCMAIMVSMSFIEANNSSLIIHADLRVENGKYIADVAEEIEFNAMFTTGPWQTLVYLFHDGSAPFQTTQTRVTHAFPLEGKYLVTLMAVGVGGISDTATVEITIRNLQPHVAIP
ncbi:MAG: PKD domain-containing protein [Candidatus Helarchaeota archaeon]